MLYWLPWLPQKATDALWEGGRTGNIQTVAEMVTSEMELIS